VLHFHQSHLPKAGRVRGSSPELSVVIPVVNEAENLHELWDRLQQPLSAAGVTFEVIFVDDGSTDASPSLINSLTRRYPGVVNLRLSRNFGHQGAISAGLSHARGRAVIVMDGDLQDPPELIPELLKLWRQGHEVVYAVRRSRQGSLLKRVAYRGFYRLLASISELPIPLDSGDFCLMDRCVVHHLNALPEQARFIRGLRGYVGFRQTALAYDRPGRSAGQPKYTLRKLMLLAVDGLISFSSYPLRLVTYMGLASALLALGLGIWVVNDAIGANSAPKGWASTLVVVLFMGAIQLLSLGIVGEYIRLIFIETKRRPSHIVAEITRHDEGVHAESDDFGGCVVSDRGRSPLGAEYRPQPPFVPLGRRGGGDRAVETGPTVLS
jgi:dolichol-phosphate mannosyltransferase